MKKPTPRPVDSSVLIITGVGLAALFASVSIAYIGPVAGYLALGLALPFVFLITRQFDQSSGRHWIFILAFIFPLLLSVLLKITGVRLFGIWQACLMLIALFGIGEFWRQVTCEKRLQWFLIAFFVFMVLGIYSSLTGRSHFYAASYQLASDLKPLLAVILGYMLRWDARTERILWFVIRWFWLLAALLVLFEWAAPGTYFNVFPSGTGRASPDPSGMFPSRALGPFEHSSFLAGITATFVVLAVSRALTSDTRSWSSWPLAAVYSLLLVVSVQRQELAACAAAVLLVILLAKPGHLLPRLILVAVLSVIAIIAFWVTFSESLSREVAMWGIGTVGPIEHPRAQIFSDAWYLAHHYFPSGAGLGTFAGAGAEKFDTSLYEYLGFRRYWWYGREDYLMDTYWPNSLAETGFFGAMALLSSYLLLFSYGIERCIRAAPAARLYWTVAAGLMGYMLLLSASSPAFQDLRLFVLPALMFGIATRGSQDVRHGRE